MQDIPATCSRNESKVGRPRHRWAGLAIVVAIASILVGAALIGNDPKILEGGTPSSGAAAATSVAPDQKAAASAPQGDEAPDAQAVGPRHPVGPKASIALPADAVRIRVGDDWQQIIDRHPPATRFVAAAGVHRQVSIRPKDGQEFWGQFGAICDGENQTPFFLPAGTAQGVLLRNLTIRNYRPPEQQGAIEVHPELRLEDLEIHHSSGFACRVVKWAKRCYFHHNAQGGWTVYKSNGALIEDCENAFDNWLRQFSGIPRAHMTAKIWESDDVTVRYCYSHDNQGPGIWADCNNRNLTIHHCRVANNAGPGIEQELGYAASIHHNVISGGAQRMAEWDAPAGIFVYNSSDVEIYANRISDYDVGIMLKSSERSGEARQKYGDFVTARCRVRDNDVERCNRLVVVRNYGDDVDPTQADNTFSGNRYRSATGLWPFVWGSRISWTGWQAAGNDAAGSFSRD